MKLYVGWVAPSISLHVDPELVDTCHWIDGDGFAEPVATNEAVVPTATVWSVGWIVTLGATFTVSFTAFEVPVPPLLVKMAWKRLL